MKAMRKVLVIDDDPVVGTSFDRVLAPKGYAVIAAANGNEALERLVREDYDVVYTDIKMPGMNGLDVARRIKATRPWLPVVIVTGYGTEANEREARRLGATAFLRKPLSPEMIEDSLEEAVLKVKTEAFTPVEPHAAPAPPVAEAPVVEAAAAEMPAKMTPALFAKNVALFVAAPLVGLAYVVVGPFIGLGALAYFGFRALTGRAKREAR